MELEVEVKSLSARKDIIQAKRGSSQISSTTTVILTCSLSATNFSYIYNLTEHPRSAHTESANFIFFASFLLYIFTYVNMVLSNPFETGAVEPNQCSYPPPATVAVGHSWTPTSRGPVGGR